MKQSNVFIALLLVICFAGIGYFSYLETSLAKVEYALISLLIFLGFVFLKEKLLNDGSCIYKVVSIYIVPLCLICSVTGFVIGAFKRLEGSSTIEILWKIFSCHVMLLYFIWSSKYLASSDKNSQVQKAE